MSNTEALDTLINELLMDVLSIAEHYYDATYQGANYPTIHGRSNMNGAFGDFEKKLQQHIDRECVKAVEKARSKDPFKCNFGHEVYGHKTADGYCCACEADVALSLGKLNTGGSKDDRPAD